MFFIIYGSGSQPVGRGALLVGRQLFFILLKVRISDTSFIKKYKVFLISYKSIQMQQNESISTKLKALNKQKMFKSCVVGRKNVYICLKWATMLPTLRNMIYGRGGQIFFFRGPHWKQN